MRGQTDQNFAIPVHGTADLGAADRRRVDLHTHSTASDGSCSPEELVKRAELAGLSAVALTDHDTVSGLAAFCSAGAASSVATVPGVELSTRYYNREIHIVGLFIDPTTASLAKALTRMREGRALRNARLIEKLQQGGYDVSEDLLAQYTQGESPGRPHIARMLIDRGYFLTMNEAFSKCLKRGTPYYVPREFLPPGECIRLIHEAGGLAIWAHPLYTTQRNPRSTLRKFLNVLRPLGLDGMETYYSMFTKEHRQLAHEQAEAFGLLESGGSDYHGENQPTIELGTGRGDLHVPFSLYEKLSAEFTIRGKARTAVSS